MQIYCEEVEDLLSGSIGPSASLCIREKAGKVFVEGLSKCKVECLADFWNILERGDKKRATAATNVNNLSSRGHAALILTLVVPESDNKYSLGSKEDKQDRSSWAQPSSSKSKSSMRESTLMLVDLAGSER